MRAPRSCVAAARAASRSPRSRAAPPAPPTATNLTGLHVIDGGVWHADNQFYVEWDPNPPGHGKRRPLVRSPTAPTGNASSCRRRPERWNGADRAVPPTPGVYLFEANNWQP